MNNETKHSASLVNTGKNIAALSSLPKNAASLSSDAKHTAAMETLNKNLSTGFLLCEDASYLLVESHDRIILTTSNPWSNLAKSV